MSLSVWTKMDSVCGAVKGYSVQIDDAALNPHGVICCGNCECIVVARESWAIAFGYHF
jgi:hypothetical protein